MSKLSLYGFNNLTKSLSFSLYKLNYLKDHTCSKLYRAHIEQYYCADKLNTLLTRICHAIGGNVLNVACQDYQPQGASVTLMISEEAVPVPLTHSQATSETNIRNESLVAHLDKSHLCIHTYPDEAPQDGIAIFRADIELSTCGVISPLKVINYVIEEFNADVIDIDYRIRGMTRASNGEMLFSDGKHYDISEYLSTELLSAYSLKEDKLVLQNIFHAKLSKKEILMENYLFNLEKISLPTHKQKAIKTQISQVIQQLNDN